MNGPVRTHAPKTSAAQEMTAILKEGLHKKYEADLEARNLAKQGSRSNPYISDAGKCPRQVWLHLHGTEPTEPLQLSSLINFNVGHAAERAFAEIFKAQGAELIEEFHVEIPVGETIVTGRSDFILAWPEKSALVELKTTSSWNIKAMAKKGVQGQDEHRRQLNLYLHASQLGLMAHRFERAFLVYCVKDATKGMDNIHTFEVAYDKDQAEADLQSLALVDSLEVAPGIPEGFKRSAYPCSYCGVRTFCWNGMAS